MLERRASCSGDPDDSGQNDPLSPLINLHVVATDEGEDLILPVYMYK